MEGVFVRNTLLNGEDLNEDEDPLQVNTSPENLVSPATSKSSVGFNLNHCDDTNDKQQSDLKTFICKLCVRPYELQRRGNLIIKGFCDNCLNQHAGSNQSAGMPDNGDTSCSSEAAPHVPFNRQNEVESVENKCKMELLNCPYCSKHFRFQKALNEHFKLRYSGKYNCSLCDGKFCSMRDLNEHESSHAREEVHLSNNGETHQVEKIKSVNCNNVILSQSVETSTNNESEKEIHEVKPHVKREKGSIKVENSLVETFKSLNCKNTILNKSVKTLMNNESEEEIHKSKAHVNLVKIVLNNPDRIFKKFILCSLCNTQIPIDEVSKHMESHTVFNIDTRRLNTSSNGEISVNATAEETSVNQDVKKAIKREANVTEETSVKGDIREMVERGINVTEETSVKQDVMKPFKRDVKVTEEISVKGDIRKAVERDVNVTEETSVKGDVTKPVERDINVTEETSVKRHVRKPFKRDVKVTEETSVKEDIRKMVERDVNVTEETSVKGDVSKTVERDINVTEETSVKRHVRKPFKRDVKVTEETSVKGDVREMVERDVNVTEETLVKRDVRKAVKRAYSTTEGTTVKQEVKKKLMISLCYYNYQCELCDEHLESLESLKSHLTTDKHANHVVLITGISLSCKQCNNVFSNINELKEHMIDMDHIIKYHIEEDDIVMFNCALCNKAFINEADMKTHKYYHTDTVKLVRKIPNLELSKTDLENVDVPKKVVPQLPDKHASTTSNQIFISQLENHKTLLCSGGNTCKMCHKTFKSLTSLKQHITRFKHNIQPHSTTLQNGLQGSPVQSDQFKSTTSLEKLDSVENVTCVDKTKRKPRLGVKKFVCQFCKSKYKRKTFLQKHIQSVHLPSA